jgi:RNA polymerase sigma-B factor
MITQGGSAGMTGTGAGGTGTVACGTVTVPRQERPAGERSRSDEDLERLATLAADDPERAVLRCRVVEAHLPLVRYLAQRYRDLGEPLDDLVQVGTIGLIKAVDRYDPSRGVALVGYATPTILGEIKRHFRDRAWAVRVPRRLQELQNAMTCSRAELTQRLGRPPTVPELARSLTVSEDVVLQALEAQRAYTAVPLDRPDSADLLDSAFVGLDPALEKVLDRESLRPLLTRLPRRQRQILALRYLRGLSQSEIALEVGISQMHVSRLLARTVDELRQGLADS